MSHGSFRSGARLLEAGLVGGFVHRSPPVSLGVVGPGHGSTLLPSMNHQRLVGFVTQHAQRLDDPGRHRTR